MSLPPHKKKKKKMRRLLSHRNYAFSPSVHIQITVSSVPEKKYGSDVMQNNAESYIMNAAFQCELGISNGKLFICKSFVISEKMVA